MTTIPRAPAPTSPPDCFETPLGEWPCHGPGQSMLFIWDPCDKISNASQECLSRLLEIKIGFEEGRSLDGRARVDYGRMRSRTWRRKRLDLADKGALPAIGEIVHCRSSQAFWLRLPAELGSWVAIEDTLHRTTAHSPGMGRRNTGMRAIHISVQG